MNGFTTWTIILQLHCGKYCRPIRIEARQEHKIIMFTNNILSTGCIASYLHIWFFSSKLHQISKILQEYEVRLFFLYKDLFHLEALGNHDKGTHCWRRNRLREKAKLEIFRMVYCKEKQRRPNWSVLVKRKTVLQEPVWDWVWRGRGGEERWILRLLEFWQASLEATYHQEI